MELSETVTAPRQPDSTNPLALALRDVHRTFGTHLALEGISLEIASGQRVALLGPNGAGKTTLVRAICNRLKIDRGAIEIFGIPHQRPRALDSLGVVPQELAIYQDLTTEQNLSVFGRLHGLSGKPLRERVDWAVRWIGLEDRRHHLTKTFSGGMKRRVNIACGVLHSPRILLLDEPTVGVDPQSRHRIFEMLDELSAQGTTVVLTTHHLDEAQNYCDRIVVVDHGKIIADGTFDELVEQTTGSQYSVFLRIEGQLSASVPNLEWDHERECFIAQLGEPADELPYLLQRIRVAGGQVVDLEMHQPDLQDVFLCLTGHDLRE